MARCDLPLYKNVLPKVKLSSLTAKQQERLSKLDTEKKNKFINERIYADEAQKDLFESLETVFKQRLESKTNKGVQIPEYVEQARKRGLEQASKLGLTPDELKLGEDIFVNIKKGELLNAEERALAIPAFINRFQNQTFLNKQWERAYALGDQEQMARIGAELMQSLAVYQGFKADRNAWSVAGQVYRYMYKQMQTNNKISKLFPNGEC